MQCRSYTAITLIKHIQVKHGLEICSELKNHKRKKTNMDSHHTKHLSTTKLTLKINQIQFSLYRPMTNTYQPALPKSIPTPFQSNFIHTLLQQINLFIPERQCKTRQNDHKGKDI